MQNMKSEANAAKKEIGYLMKRYAKMRLRPLVYISKKTIRWFRKNGLGLVLEVSAILIIFYIIGSLVGPEI